MILTTFYEKFHLKFQRIDIRIDQFNNMYVIYWNNKDDLSNSLYKSNI